MSEATKKQQMVTLGLSLYQRGYSAGGAGNLSTRLDSQRILITPRGASLGRLEPHRLSVLDMQGNLLAGDKPSKEYVFHLALYQHNQECQGVVHLHSSYLTALACLQDLNQENAISAFTPYFVMRIGKLPVIPYYPPGDINIAKELAKRAKQAKAFLLANHGVVVTGNSLVEAIDNAEELEETAKLLFILQGKKIRYFSQKEIQDLKNGGNYAQICR